MGVGLGAGLGWAHWGRLGGRLIGLDSCLSYSVLVVAKWGLGLSVLDWARAGLCWIWLVWLGLCWASLGWAGSGWLGLDVIGPGWPVLCWVWIGQLLGVGLGWAWLDWAGLCMQPAEVSPHAHPLPPLIAACNLSVSRSIALYLPRSLFLSPPRARSFPRSMG